MSEINGVKIEDGRITCSGLTVTTEDCPSIASIQTSDQGVGIWISKKKDGGKNCIAIYQLRNHTVIGLYDGEKEKYTAIDMGICAEQGGDAFFQTVSKDGKVSQLNPEQFEKLLEANKQAGE